MKVSDLMYLQALFDKKDKPERFEKKTPPNRNDLDAYIRVTRFLEKQKEKEKKEADEKKKKDEKGKPSMDTTSLTLLFLASFPIIAPMYLYYIAKLLSGLPKF